MVSLGIAKILWSSFRLGSVLLTPILFAPISLANEPVPNESVTSGSTFSVADLASISLDSDLNYDAGESYTLTQVTAVSQLSDVQPTDWAFQALQSLVERYGCIAGFPDQTYRGNRSLSRYEFAAGLNACLDRVLEIAGSVDETDLEAIKRLQAEFAAELATLRGRVDSLEARTAELEANQFSTTTKLEGVVLFAGAGAIGDTADGDDIDDGQITFGQRTRLNFVTSFTGRDILFTRLQSDGLIDPDLGTVEGDLFFAEDDAEGDFILDTLLYSFPIGKRTEVLALANAGASDDFASTVNIIDGDGDVGALSTFASRNPILFLLDGTGFGFRHQFNDVLEVNAGYTANDAFDPAEGAGLFNGAYGALAQLTITPNDNLEIGLTYINAFENETGTGSPLSNFLTFTEDEFGEVVPTVSNAYGVEISWQATDRFVLGGWAGFIKATTLTTLDGTIDGGSQDILNWAVTFAFPDLGSEGSLGAIVVGMEPRVIDSSIELPGIDSEDESTSIHIEAFYQYQINDNIAITPGLIVLTAPGSDSDNDAAFIGSIRTTFTF
ncbi:MAG: iron uptake porin [Cyanothece sp. SIO1E1]|nr:iron uptake porin [Cyanothece sp. SIO1E1]